MQSETKLKRQLGAGTLAISAINLTVGAGIFVLPAQVAGWMGPSSFLAYIGCGVLISLVMLCFAEMGSRVPGTGGAYAYIESSFGPLAGFLTNSLLWFGWAVLADAALMNVMADTLAVWWPIFSNFWFRALFFALVLGVFGYVNIMGVKSGANMVVAMTALKLTPLFLLVIIGVFGVESENLAISELPAFSSFGSASLILFFAFMGTESALNVSGEMKNPTKSIPMGIFMGIGGVLIIYMLIQFVATGVLGNELQQYTETPLAETAIRLVGPLGGTVILMTMVVSIYGTLGGDVLASSRLPFAAAQDDLLPKAIGRVHPKHKTPSNAIVLFCISIFVMAISGGFRILALLASSSALLVYLGVALAVIKSRRWVPKEEAGIFKIPGGLTVPVLSVGIIVWLLTYMLPNEVLMLAAFFGLVTIYYFVNRSLRQNRNPAD